MTNISVFNLGWSVQLLLCNKINTHNKKLEGCTPASYPRFPPGAGAKRGYCDYVASFYFSAFSSFSATSRKVYNLLRNTVMKMFQTLVWISKCSKLKAFFSKHLYTPPPTSTVRLLKWLYHKYVHLLRTNYRRGGCWHACRITLPLTNALPRPRETV